MLLKKLLTITLLRVYFVHVIFSNLKIYYWKILLIKILLQYFIRIRRFVIAVSCYRFSNDNSLLNLFYHKEEFKIYVHVYSIGYFR